MTAEEARARIRALGFSGRDAESLFAHFDEAERAGKLGHGYSRIEWLERELRDSIDPAAAPERVAVEDGLERWHGRGALGYLTLAAICDSVLADPPAGARVVVAQECFPTGMLGHYARRLADGGLVCLLTATSPPRLPHPDGGPPLVPTIPLAIGLPSSDGRPLVADVSMARRTYGEVLAGLASPDELVAFGGDQAYKAFALAAGLTLAAQALAGHEQSMLLVVARPQADPVPAFRRRAGGLRLPGDR